MTLEQAILARLETVAKHLEVLTRAHLNLQAKVLPMSISTDLKAVLDEISSQTDTLINSLEATTNSKSADNEGLSDNLTEATAIRDKLKAQNDKIAAQTSAAQASAAQGSTPAPAAPVSVTVAAPTVAPELVVPVTTNAPVPVGSAVSGPGIPTGATVVASDASSVTLSDHTTDDHAGDGTETLTVMPPLAATVDPANPIPNPTAV